MSQLSHISHHKQFFHLTLNYEQIISFQNLEYYSVPGIFITADMASKNTIKPLLTTRAMETKLVGNSGKYKKILKFNLFTINNDIYITFSLCQNRFVGFKPDLLFVFYKIRKQPSVAVHMRDRAAVNTPERNILVSVFLAH